MDEPFGALDTITKADIHSEFKSLEELKSKTIILVTHDVQEAFELGHRICLMDQGKLYRPVLPEKCFTTLKMTLCVIFSPKTVFIRV